MESTVNYKVSVLGVQIKFACGVPGGWQSHEVAREPKVNYSRTSTSLEDVLISRISDYSTRAQH